MAYMPPEEFIRFLRRHCSDMEVKEFPLWSFEAGKNTAYHDIAQFIDVYLKEKENEAVSVGSH